MSAVLIAVGLAAALVWPPIAAAVVPESQLRESQAYYERALEKMAEGNDNVAEILLRNALQQNPENLPARIALGITVLDLDKPRLAINELEEALRLGADENLVLPNLARAYLAVLEPESVLTKIIPTRSLQLDTTGEIYLARAEAYLMLGAKDKASSAYAEASLRLPTDYRPPLGLARIAVIERKYQNALTMMDKAVLLNPQAADAWSYKATLMRDLRQYPEALKSFERALTLNPSSTSTLASRAAMWIDLGEFDRARQDIAEVRRLGEASLQTIYVETLLLFSEGKLDEARALLSTTATDLLEIPDELKDKLPNTRLMLGIIAYFNGNYDTALVELKKFLDKVPDHLGAKRYLASAYLALRDWDKVIRTYQVNSRDPVPHDPVAISLVAEAYRQQGRYRQAEELYETALRISPRSAGLALKLAQSRLDAGDLSKAHKDIEALAERFPDWTEARIQLARVHVRLGDYDAALAIAIELTDKHPDSVDARIMLGAVYIAMDRFDEAEQVFLHVSEDDPTLIQPWLNLGRLTLIRGDVETAEAYFRAVLVIHPNNLDAGQELVKLLLARRESKEAEEKVEAMLEYASDALHLHILKLKIGLLRAEDEATANALIYGFAGRFERNAEALVVAARAYVAIGNNQAALGFYRRAVELAGYDEKLLLAIAEGQIKLNGYEPALWTIEKVNTANPSNLFARATKINLLRILGQLDRAEETLLETPEAMRGEYQILMSEARLYRALHRYEHALDAFERAAEQQRTAEVVRAIFHLRRRLGDTTRAFDELAAWVAQRPSDIVSRHMLASTYILDKRFEEAKGVYENLLADEVSDIVLLNNLATVYQRLNDERALASAERAYQMEPDNPQVIDTYGWILTERGQPEKALPLLREAHARSATDPGIRYHIALALSKLGRKNQAIKELQAALGSGAEFREADQAEALLDKLQTN